MDAQDDGFRTLFELSPEAIALAVLDTGEILQVNRAWCDLTGFTEQEALGRTPKDLGLWAEPAERDRYYARLREEASVGSWEATLVSRAGETLQALFSARVLEFQGRPCTLLIIRDVTERQRDALALRSSEARYRLLFDLSPDAICMIRHRDQVLLEVNLAWERMTGVPRSRALGTTTRALGLYASKADRDEAYRQLDDTGQLPPRTMTLRRQDGQRFEAQVAAGTAEVDGERVLMVVTRDVSQDVLARKKLERLNQRYSKLMSTALDGIHVVDARGRLLEWNPAFLAHLGYAEEEGAGLCIADWDAGTAPEEVPGLIARLMGAGGRFETLHRRKDGTLRNVEISAAGISLDGQELLLAAVRDITERKQAEAELMASETLYRELLASQGEGFGMVDGDERFLLANNMADEIFGVPPGTLQGRSLREFLSPEELVRVQRETERRGRGLSSTYELTIRREDGATRDILVTATPRNLPAGGPPLSIGVFRDITTTKQLEAAEFRARKAESLVLMAGSIAHDFNNLFQALQASLDIAELQAREPREALPTLGAAKDILRRAIALSWKMNDFSGRVITQRRTLQLDRLIPAWASRPDCPLRNAPPALDLPEVPPVEGDPGQIMRVLDEFARNALEAMEDGGLPGRVRIRLFLDAGDHGPGSPGVWAADPPRVPATVCLEFSNPGPTPGPEVLARMFDPFFTTRALGRGLGLPSALGLLQAQGAGVQVLAGTPTGLVIRVHFPPAGLTA